MHLSPPVVGQDLLEPDWDVRPAPASSGASAPASSCVLRGSSVSQGDPEMSRPQQTGESSAPPCHGTFRGSLLSTAPALGRTPSNSSLQSRGHEPMKAQDDFDDWDVDLKDLDEGQIWQPLPSPASPAPPAKTLRPPSHGGLRSPPDQSPASRASTSTATRPPPQTLSSPLPSPCPRPVVRSAPLPSPNLYPSPTPRPLNRPQQQQQQQQRHTPSTTPRPHPRPRGLFDAPSAPSAALSPHPLHTPVLTNRLVQLVSASNKLPRKRPRSGGHQPRTRRFPGPAGLLPEQVGLPWPSLVCVCVSSSWAVFSLRLRSPCE